MFECDSKPLFQVSGTDAAFDLNEAPVLGKLLSYTYNLSHTNRDSKSASSVRLSAQTRKRLVEVFRDADPAFQLTASLDPGCGVRDLRLGDVPWPADKALPQYAQLVSAVVRVVRCRT